MSILTIIILIALAILVLWLVKVIKANKEKDW